MYFRVIMHGDGICLVVEDGPEGTGDVEPAIGFFTTRKVRAKNSVHAVELAKELILREWVDGEYSSANSGELPDLSVDSIHRIRLLRYLFPNYPTKGYTFYTRT